MKKLYPIPIVAILISTTTLANGDIRTLEKSSSPERTEKTREKMRENPRNSSFPGSFGQIHPRFETQERQEEKEEWLDNLTEGLDPYWNTGDRDETNKREKSSP